MVTLFQRVMEVIHESPVTGYVVLFKKAGWLQCEEQITGPYPDYDTALEALSLMPVPGNGGHKYIAPVLRRLQLR